MVLEKTLESHLDCKEIQPVHPKGNQSWIFIGRTDAEAETPILWAPDVKNWLIGKKPDAGNDWRQEKKGTTEDEMVRWHHQLDVREFEQALGVGDGQGSLACCSSWGLRVRHNWVTKLTILKTKKKSTLLKMNKKLFVFVYNLFYVLQQDMTSITQCKEWWINDIICWTKKIEK